MLRCTILRSVTIAVTLTGAMAQAAGPLHSLGRHYGHGWSDGYHAKPALVAQPQAAGNYFPAEKPLPWWMIPADGSEPLPQPALKQPVTSRVHSSSGPTLFRQPGDGSLTSPSLMR